jgi:beta-lactamase class A
MPASFGRKVLLTCGLLLLGFALGRFLPHHPHCDSDKYPHINQQIVCGEKPVVAKYSYVRLNRALQDYIQSKKDSKEATEVSVYIRDLEYGPTLGIDEHEKFSPASLLKIPLLLTYLQISKEQPEILERRLMTPQAFVDGFSQSIKPTYELRENTSYTVNELLSYMIKFSDNRAYFMLLDYLKEIAPGRDLLAETFVDLGIIDPRDPDDQTISVKAYASIFIQLFHVSFLQDQDLSEKALALLAESEFDAGLSAGVPAGTVVADKFGERTNFDGELKQLHDCGIIYFPGNPYALCVMTRGNDIEKLPPIIAAISKMVYEEFEARRF